MAKHLGLVAITGANGTIGYACTIYALKKGYDVRCIVRREDAIATIKLGPSLQPYIDRIQFAVVPDNAIEGAYDEAIKGAKYVVHIAGVWPTPNYHPDSEIYWPFVESMENILSAARKAGTVKRIVFTQAGAGLVSPDDGDTLGTKMNQVLDEYVKVNPQSAAFRPPLPSQHHAYCGAKAYCMEYLRDLSRSGQLPFSIVQVIPGTVMGPSELVSSAPKALSQMDRMSKALLFNGMKPRYAFGFVHVEDCAKVHIEALDEEKVKSENIPDWFVSAATSEVGQTAEELWRSVGKMIEADFAKDVESGLFKVGKDNVPINVPYRVDSGLTERLLMGGESFRSLSDCVKEVGVWYKELLEEQKV